MWGHLPMTLHRDDFLWIRGCCKLSFKRVMKYLYTRRYGALVIAIVVMSCNAVCSDLLVKKIAVCQNAGGGLRRIPEYRALARMQQAGNGRSAEDARPPVSGVSQLTIPPLVASKTNHRGKRQSPDLSSDKNSTLLLSKGSNLK